MKIAFCGYRSWASKILDNLTEYTREFNTGWEFTNEENADIVLYYGWSWKIPEEIISKKPCFILHPSLLPKYRGGSPLQHQIIAGEKQSAVTILKANDKIDSGEIYSQTKFSLDGTLNEIFNRIADIGTKDTIDLINAIEKGKYSPIAQDESQATTFKRRKPEESEINFEDFKK
jgi:methionyl-tRNA formyltransferase